MTFCTRSNRFIVQEESPQSYHELINNFNNWHLVDPYYTNLVGSIGLIDSTVSHNFTIIYQKESLDTPKVMNQFNMHSALNSKLLIPYHPTIPKNAKIDLTYMSVNLKYVKLVTSLLDEKENQILSDTLNATYGNEFLGTCSKTIPLNDARFFYLELIAEGIDSTYWDNGKGHIDSACIQNLVIWELDIEFDGKNLRDFYEKDILPSCKINPEDIIPIVDENSFELIPELKEKKIIAIGESAHGSEAFEELFVKMVKHIVSQDQCRLILLEWDMSETLIFNGFIQGHEGFDIDSIMYEGRSHLFSNKQLKDMLLFLKDYNHKAENKVWLMGIDFSSTINSNLNAAKYFYAINENHNYKQIDSVCYNLIEKYLTYIVDFQNFEYFDWFNEILNETERELFFFCFQNYIKYHLNKSDSYEEQAIIREKWMFEHVKYLIDLICGEEKDKKVLIKGHSAHLNNNKIGTNNSFGHYMKDFYGDQYSNICLIVSNGELRSACFPNDNNWNNYPLTQNNRSIEFALSNFSHDCMYVPVTSLDVPHICIREIGAANNDNHFIIVSPSLRYDAFIYMNHTEAAQPWPETIVTICDPNYIINEQRQSLYDKIIRKIEPYP